jgi:hypothetical protein
MFYNFNVYRGRKIFNLNFAARNDKQAIAEASKLVPNFKNLRWVLWYCPPNGRKWREGLRNPPARSPVESD